MLRHRERPSRLRAESTAPNDTQRSAHRWLILVHQLPAQPSNLRVRTWRRLQQIGALAVKQAVYVLPDSANAREDFEWLKTDIERAGGQASIFAADTVDSWSHDALVEEFRRSRQDAYTALAREAEVMLRRVGTDSRRSKRMPSRRMVQQLRERLTAVEHIDFFGSAGRDRVVTLVRQIEEHAGSTSPAATTVKGGAAQRSYRGELWVTRPRPGVDRMASAWLIRRFIDREARFAFAADRGAVPRDGIPFDMFGVEFSHQNEGCTFETLCTVFAIDEPAVVRIAAIVHDLDLKDGRFGAAEAATVGAVIEGLQLAHGDDEALLEHGMSLFDSLYRSFEQSSRSAGPRVLAKPRSKTTSTRRQASLRRRRRV
jgi:hypothetical protein